MRIMTGAPVPAGADAVQRLEVTRELDGGILVEITQTVALKQSITKQASEIKAGATVFDTGERITAQMIAVLASFGYATIKVRKRPRVAVIATGSELVAVENQPGPDNIRDSNSYSLAAYAELTGALAERLPLAGDDPKLLQEMIAAVAEQADLLVLSGGVSVGAYDFTKAALRALNAEIIFERVALRPGKPTVFARLPQPGSTLVLGLPGNPVSAAVTFNLFARTALLAMQGASDATMIQERAILSDGIKGSAGRISYLPGRLITDEEGRLIAEPLRRWGGSSDFVAFAQATALIIVPEDVKMLDAGAKVNVVRLPG